MNQFEPNVNLPSVSSVHKAAHLHGAIRPDLIKDELLSEIFAATVRTYPESLALTGPEGQWTYAQLDAEATAIARGLIQAGVRATDVVGLWMARGPHLLIAQIAIAKTGAAWLPFDGDAPLDRIAVCLEDAKAKLLVTSQSHREHAAGRVACAVHTPEQLAQAPDTIAVDARANGATSASPAYVIYTSGSTGVPKGILVSNRNICHYLRAANVVYGLTADDIVFQGASVAFDLSMEEIWLPYLVGARLFVATADIMGEADKLPEVMLAAGITVLDTVPTLLAMLQSDIPSLRIIILGGEACPPAIARRWCRAGRHLFNSYGPTEATVVATIAEVLPDAPVTIGRPIPNYSCYIVDDGLNLVGPGVEGELLIGGPGVAMGYLNRDELTQEKFIPNPFAARLNDPVLYRSGDAVVLDDTGNIAFRGRIDDQVKVRGFRIELGEIEARLGQIAGISHAAVAVRQEYGMDELVAFIVCAPGETVSARDLRHILRDQLPAYMVPGRFETVESLPKLSSGKVDRKALKLLPLSAPVNSEVQEAPQTATEAILLSAMQQVLPPQAIAFEADFFTELGGHSLLAARFVSLVRQTHHLASLTLQDMYAFRSLRAIAAELDRKSAGTAPQKDLSFVPPPLLRRFLCGLAQAVALPFILTLLTAQWLGVFISYLLLTDVTASIADELISLVLVYTLIDIATIFLVIGAKWLIIGRLKPGRYPLWGVYYYRFWLVDRLLTIVHLNWIQGSPFIRYFFNALGAKIGKDVIIGNVKVHGVDLLTIGAGTSVGDAAQFSCSRVVGNELIIEPIHIGADCSIGTAAVIEGGASMGDGAQLGGLGALRSGVHIPAWDIWEGSPARKTGIVDPASLPEAPKVTTFRRWLNNFVYIFSFLILPPIGLIPIYPAFYFYDQLDEILNVSDPTLYLLSIPLYAWPAAMVMVVLTVVLIIALRWIIMPTRGKEGVYSIHSWVYLQKWILGFATEVALDTIGSIYATIYMPLWYRLMGSKIGKNTEISVNLAGRFDLVDVGSECFLGDELRVGDETVQRGWMSLQRIHIGNRVFIGNNSLVPPGADIPDGTLIGIKSVPPANDQMQQDQTWFGLPPIKFPNRQRVDIGGEEWTYTATTGKKIGRGLFEILTTSLPQALTITEGVWAITFIEPVILTHNWLNVIWVTLLSSCAISATLTIVVIIFKWLTMGRYKPMVKPMWSWWAIISEAVTVMCGVAEKSLLTHLQGTPMLPWVYRLLGMKVGQGVYLDTTDFTEFDCVSIGSFSAINAGAALQTHLYEDRVMKIGRVHVQDGVTVGPGATVLYDSNVGKWAQIGPLTVVMKGESLPAHTQWCGAPAEPRRED